MWPQPPHHQSQCMRGIAWAAPAHHMGTWDTDHPHEPLQMHMAMPYCPVTVVSHVPGLQPGPWHWPSNFYYNAAVPLQVHQPASMPRRPEYCTEVPNNHAASGNRQVKGIVRPPGEGKSKNAKKRKLAASRVCESVRATASASAAAPAARGMPSREEQPKSLPQAWTDSIATEELVGIHAAALSPVAAAPAVTPRGIGEVKDASASSASPSPQSKWRGPDGANATPGLEPTPTPIRSTSAPPQPPLPTKRSLTPLRRPYRSRWL